MMSFFKIKKLFVFIFILVLACPCIADDFMDHPSVMIVTDKPKEESFVNKLKFSPKEVIINSPPVQLVKELWPFKSKKKKLNFEDVDNKAPKFQEDYLELVRDVKREEIKLPDPKYDKDTDKMDFPDPKIQIKKYNIPPGTQDINLNNLVKDRRVDSVGVISPDHRRMVYSSVYYYPTVEQTSSDMFVIDIGSFQTLEQKLKTANPLNKDMTPILTAGTENLVRRSIRSLVLVDWSSDSSMVAVKEKIGSNRAGIWKTKLHVYDFKTKQSKELNELREAIRYWWKTNKDIDLIDYMWDIYPVGWDKANPDRIIVYAYAFTDSRPKFLGSWSIDSKGETSQLLSLERTDFAISINGLKLKIIPHY